MSEENSSFENFVLFLIVGGLLLGGALYGIILFWPYFVFYFLPFLIGSVVIGWTLRIASLPKAHGQGMMDYKFLAIVYPVLIFLVMTVFFANSQKAVVLDKKGNVVGEFLDWPKLNKAFNDHRYSAYLSSPFESLKAKAKVPVIYDRSNAGWVFLWCLFFSGPLLFWYLAAEDHLKDDEVIDRLVKERTKDLRERVLEKERNLNQIISKSVEKLQEEVNRVEQEKAELLAENLVFKARLEFSPHLPKPAQVQKAPGLLDTDIF